MSHVKPRSKKPVISHATAAKVSAVAASVGLTREEALKIAKAEPRGATIFAGSLKRKGPAKRRP